MAEEERKRVLRACIACKKLRDKCDGLQPCATCTRRGKTCAYEPGEPKKRGPPKGYKRQKPAMTAAAGSRTQGGALSPHVASQKKSYRGPPLPGSARSSNISYTNPNSHATHGLSTSFAASLEGGGAPSQGYAQPPHFGPYATPGTGFSAPGAVGYPASAPPQYDSYGRGGSATAAAAAGGPASRRGISRRGSGRATRAPMSGGGPQVRGSGGLPLPADAGSPPQYELEPPAGAPISALDGPGIYGDGDNDDDNEEGDARSARGVDDYPDPDIGGFDGGAVEEVIERDGDDEGGEEADALADEFEAPRLLKSLSAAAALNEAGGTLGDSGAGSPRHAGSSVGMMLPLGGGLDGHLAHKGSYAAAAGASLGSGHLLHRGLGDVGALQLWGPGQRGGSLSSRQQQSRRHTLDTADSPRRPVHLASDVASVMLEMQSIASSGAVGPPGGMLPRLLATAAAEPAAPGAAGSAHHGSGDTFLGQKRPRHAGGAEEGEEEDQVGMALSPDFGPMAQDPLLLQQASQQQQLRLQQRLLELGAAGAGHLALHGGAVLPQGVGATGTARLNTGAPGSAHVVSSAIAAAIAASSSARGSGSAGSPSFLYSSAAAAAAAAAAAVTAGAGNLLRGGGGAAGAPSYSSSGRGAAALAPGNATARGVGSRGVHWGPGPAATYTASTSAQGAAAGPPGEGAASSAAEAAAPHQSARPAPSSQAPQQPQSRAHGKAAAAASSQLLHGYLQAAADAAKLPPVPGPSSSPAQAASAEAQRTLLRHSWSFTGDDGASMLMAAGAQDSARAQESARAHQSGQEGGLPGAGGAAATGRGSSWGAGHAGLGAPERSVPTQPAAQRQRVNPGFPAPDPGPPAPPGGGELSTVLETIALADLFQPTSFLKPPSTMECGFVRSYFLGSDRRAPIIDESKFYLAVHRMLANQPPARTTISPDPEPWGSSLTSPSAAAQAAAEAGFAPGGQVPQASPRQPAPPSASLPSPPLPSSPAPPDPNRLIQGAYSWAQARVTVDDAANVLGFRVLYYTILSIGAGMQGRRSLAVQYQAYASALCAPCILRPSEHFVAALVISPKLDAEPISWGGGSKAGAPPQSSPPQLSPPANGAKIDHVMTASMADHLSKLVPCSARLRFMAAMHCRFLNGGSAALGPSPLGVPPESLPLPSSSRVQTMRRMLGAVPMAVLLERFIDIAFRLWAEMRTGYTSLLPTALSTSGEASSGSGGGNGDDGGSAASSASSGSAGSAGVSSAAQASYERLRQPGMRAAQALLANIDEMSAISPLVSLPPGAQARVMALVSRTLIALKLNLCGIVEEEDARRVVESMRNESSLTSFDLTFLSAKVVLAVRSARAVAAETRAAAAATAVAAAVADTPSTSSTFSLPLRTGPYPLGPGPVDVVDTPEMRFIASAAAEFVGLATRGGVYPVPEELQGSSAGTAAVGSTGSEGLSHGASAPAAPAVAPPPPRGSHPSSGGAPGTAGPLPHASGTSQELSHDGQQHFAQMVSSVLEACSVLQAASASVSAYDTNTGTGGGGGGNFNKSSAPGFREAPGPGLGLGSLQALPPTQPPRVSQKLRPSAGGSELVQGGSGTHAPPSSGAAAAAVAGAQVSLGSLGLRGSSNWGHVGSAVAPPSADLHGALNGGGGAALRHRSSRRGGGMPTIVAAGASAGGGWAGTSGQTLPQGAGSHTRGAKASSRPAAAAAAAATGWQGTQQQQQWRGAPAAAPGDPGRGAGSHVADSPLLPNGPSAALLPQSSGLCSPDPGSGPSLLLLPRNSSRDFQADGPYSAHGSVQQGAPDPLMHRSHSINSLFGAHPAPEAGGHPSGSVGVGHAQPPPAPGGAGATAASSFGAMAASGSTAGLHLLVRPDSYDRELAAASAAGGAGPTGEAQRWQGGAAVAGGAFVSPRCQSPGAFSFGSLHSVDSGGLPKLSFLDFALGGAGPSAAAV